MEPDNVANDSLATLSGSKKVGLCVNTITDTTLVCQQHKKYLIGSKKKLSNQELLPRNVKNGSSTIPITVSATDVVF